MTRRTTTSTGNSSWLQLLVLLTPWTVINAAANVDSPFQIIFDGGSTGSRLHIFEFVEESEGDVKCVRRGSSRADIPLSAFGRLPPDQDDDNNPLDPTTVAAHLLPLFDFAANVIPSQYHDTTGVYYQATAGMRLLEESEQEAVYDAVYEGLLNNESFVFRALQRKDIATLSGEMEAYYGALAANFLQGIIDTELHVISAQNDSEGNTPDHPVGALDMGGSSTQIVYIANQDDVSNEDETEPTERTLESITCPVKETYGGEDSTERTCKLSDEHFFSTSYLSYGVDQIRKRLWDTLVAEYVGCDTNETCDAKIVANPCANKGYEVQYKEHALVGSGDAEECMRQMQRLIPHPDVVHDWDHKVEDWAVGGVEHPPIRGKFLAMSLYFFAFDSLRVFSKPDEEAHATLDNAWPNPSIDELQNALNGLCSRDWKGDMELQEGVHSFTRKEVLPHRCLETVYMVTLLKDGFGFHPSSRDITFTFLIDGDEVEWTLGLALAMNAEARNSAPATTVTTTAYNYDFNEGSRLIKDDRCNDTGNDVFEEEPYPVQNTLFAIANLCRNITINALQLKR